MRKHMNHESAAKTAMPFPSSVLLRCLCVEPRIPAKSATDFRPHQTKIGIPAESAMPFASPLTHSQAYPKMSTANFRQNRQPNRGFRQNRQVPFVPLASRRLVAQSIALLAAAPIADFRQKRQPHLRGSPCAPWLHFVFRQNRQPVSTRAEQKK